MRLFDSESSGNCYKVRLLLAQLRLDYERVEMDVTDRTGRDPSFLARTPIGRIPLLELDDGRCLAESNAILCFLAEGTPYLPEDRFRRAEALGWLFFEQNLHEPNIATARYWTTVLGEPERFQPMLDHKRALGLEALGAMERHLEPRKFFLADTYTIADVALFAYTHVAPEAGIALDPYPSVRAWLERVRDRPGFVPMRAGAQGAS